MEGSDERLDGHVRVSFDEFAAPTREEWYNEAVAALKGAPFEKKMFTPTYEGITLEPIYNLEDSEELQKIGGFPGFAPFMRGAHCSGYMSEPWLIAQGTADVEPKDANAAAKHELDKGATAARFELDECTLLGKDPSPEFFCGDYRGLSLSTLSDADEAFRGFDFSNTPVQIYAGASAVPMLALFAARARAVGEKDALAVARGCIGADPLGELASRGKLPVPIDELYDEMAMAIEWAENNAPNMKTIEIQGSAYHDGGASATQETAYAMSAAIAYIRAMGRRGIDTARTIRQITFRFSLGTNFFMEIARLRAARVVWTQIAEAFGADAGECGGIRVSARTAKFTETV